MRIIDLLTEESINLNAKPKTKTEAIDELVNLMETHNNLTDKAQYRQAVLKRETEGTTGIGEGIAIPHAKTDAVTKPALASMVVKDGVDFESLDGEVAKLFFLIAAPNTEENIHLEVLGRLSTLLMDEAFYQKLLNAKSKKEFLDAIDEAETKRFGNEAEKPAEEKEEEKESEKKKGDKSEGYRVLCVTACPTGIAHTYMAAEALEQAAKKMGIGIKVETNGSGGVKNELTDEEIANCEGIIVAADKNVETARFDQKKVLFVKVADGIHKPKELIEKVLSDQVAIFNSSEKHKKETKQAKESVWRVIYKHLMSGVSHMLPFVIGGGILIALAFLIDGLAGMPQDADFGTHTNAAKFFKTIGGYAFNFMLPVLSGYIAYSIADRPGLAVGFVGGVMATMAEANFAVMFNIIDGASFAAPGFLGALVAGFLGGYMTLGLKKLTAKMPLSMEGLKPTLIYPLIGILGIGVTMWVLNVPFGYISYGIQKGLLYLASNEALNILTGILVAGMMAVDMGGPINKAAYITGIATIETNPMIMAAVMIGGMVPPLAIALASTFFPKKFTKKERNDGKVNYVMGLCFITEGAIPYAASDPLRVIPACVVGSAFAGGLSAAFKCTLLAPHGGICVIPVVGNAGFYLLALVVGAVVGMLLLGIMRKKVDPSEFPDKESKFKTWLKSLSKNKKLK